MKVTSEFTDLIIFGSRGHSMMIFQAMQEGLGGTVRLRAVIDEVDNGFSHPLLGVPVISMEERLRNWADIPVLITPASTELRARIAKQLSDEGATLVTLNFPGRANIDPSVHYGPGSVCAFYTRIGPNVRIGEGSQVLGMMLAHDIEIGPYCNLNIHSSVLGHVKIGAHVNVAPHAVISNGTADRPLIIGDGAIIGVGAVVVNDIPDGARVGGNPAMDVSRWKKLNKLLNDLDD